MKLYNALNEFTRWRSQRTKCYKKEFEFIRQFVLFMRNCEVDEIQDTDITEYSLMMSSLGWADNGMVSRITAISQFFRWAEMKGMCSFNTRLIQIPQKAYTQPRVVTKEEHTKLLAVCATARNSYKRARDAAMLSILWDTGMRIGELVSINVEDLERGGCIIKSKKSRGTKPFRRVFWSIKTERAISDWKIKRAAYYDIRPDIEECEALFICVGGFDKKGGRAGLRVETSGFSQALRVMSVKAEIDHTINAHSYRHHKGHELTEKGASNSLISMVLGHVNMESSYRYTQVSDKSLESTVRQLTGMR